MKKDVFKACDFESLIEQHNPFAIKESDGRISFFQDYAEAYLYVLTVLNAYFKKGYVDIIVLVSLLTQLPLRECESLFRQMQWLWGRSAEKLISYDWDTCCSNTNKDVADIMKCLHLITETKFDEQAFDRACDLFRLKLLKGEALPFKG